MQSEFTFPTVEFTGYDATNVAEKLGHIFNKQQLLEMQNKVGKSILFNHLFVESTLKRFSLSSDGSSNQQTFGDMINLRVSAIDLI